MPKQRPMETLQFNVRINASAAKVWFVLWNDYYYRQWAQAFHEGSYAKSDWQQGSRVHFLTPEGIGMYANIDVHEPPRNMVFQHLGEIKNFQEQPAGGAWKDAFEKYELLEENGSVHLQVSVDTEEAYKGQFEKMFPIALENVKRMSEDFSVTVTALVVAPLEKVWNYWTQPAHITQWNQASDDWHTPTATNDLQVGGKFTSRMEAKDGSMGFDFEGIYDVVDWHKAIAYHMPDGRKVSVRFEVQPHGTLVKESFDPENMHSYELQYAGWQAILNNFKHYTEQH